MSNQSYDYAIIGAGAAGLHLAIKLAEDPFFKDSRILIIDKEEKTSNDRTWSFWEGSQSRWNEIATKQWRTAKFYGNDREYVLPLHEYCYKTIRSSDYYAYAKGVLQSSGIFEWAKEEVKRIEQNRVITNKKTYTARHIFDSQIPHEFFSQKEKYQSLDQHFLGWIIETEEPVFNPDEFIMMDYRLKWKNDTSFTYILPFSSTKALVEYTLFNTQLIKKEDYEAKLKEYISTFLKVAHYTIEEVEQGVIPMSDYPFHKHHTDFVTKIGTAGGWVRPSSGYSFKNGDRYSGQIITNIKKGVKPHKGVASNRFRLYDSIFLRVLKERNDLGERIFHTLYTKHPIKKLFRFLDEGSTLLEDVQIMFSLNKRVFQKSLLKSIFRS